MKATVKDKVLIIEIPLQKAEASKSGKSHIVASTHGFTAAGISVEGKPVKLNVTAII